MASPSDGNEKVGLWVPVEPGLFQYPLAQGEAPALLANRCKKCKKCFFPKRKLCPACFETDMEEIRPKQTRKDLQRGGCSHPFTRWHKSAPMPMGM